MNINQEENNQIFDEQVKRDHKVKHPNFSFVGKTAILGNGKRVTFVKVGNKLRAIYEPTTQSKNCKNCKNNHCDNGQKNELND